MNTDSITSVSQTMEMSFEANVSDATTGPGETDAGNSISPEWLAIYDNPWGFPWRPKDEITPRGVGDEIEQTEWAQLASRALQKWMDENPF